MSVVEAVDIEETEGDRLGRAIGRALMRIVRRTTFARCGGVVEQVGPDGSKGEKALRLTLSFDTDEAKRWTDHVLAAFEAGDVAEVWRLCEEA